MVSIRRSVAAVASALFAAAILTLFAAPRAQAGYPGKIGVIAFDSDFPGFVDPEIFTMPPIGGPPYTQLTFDVLGNTENDNDPAYSGDGKKIVWEGDTDVPGGGDDEIFMMNADGTGQVQLTPTSNTGADDEDPAISWDGKRVVFECEDPDDEICVMNSDGTGRIQLTNNTISDAEPVFSRDGTRIYYESDADDQVNFETEIWVMNAVGTGQRQLTSGPGFSGDPDVSPDDREVTFVSDRENQVTFAADVWVMNADASGQTKLTSLPAGETAARPAFSPDGTRIVFDHILSDDDEIFVMNTDGSGLMPLTNDDDSANSPDWQPIPVFCGGRQATLVGTEGPDTIVGTTAADVIAGLGGKDKLSGLAAKDRLCGGKGKDTLRGGGGNDKLFGQAGNDKLKAGKGKKDRCVGGKGKDKAKGCEKTKSI